MKNPAEGSRGRILCASLAAVVSVSCVHRMVTVELPVDIDDMIRDQTQVGIGSGLFMNDQELDKGEESAEGILRAVSARHMGVTYPNGSSLHVDFDRGVVQFTNTRGNIGLLTEYFAPFRTDRPPSRIESDMVKRTDAVAGGAEGGRKIGSQDSRVTDGGGGVDE